MQISVARDSFTARFEVKTEHEKEELFWSGKIYDKTELFKDNWDSLKYINQYWDSQTKQSQTEIFEVYKSIREVFQSATTVSGMMSQLYPLVQTLLDDYHDLDEIEQWVVRKTDIVVPANIQESMEYEAGSNVTSEKTYLKKDYIKLIAFAIACQSVIPVWCEFVRSVGNAVGPDFKKWQAFKLISRSKLWRCDAINMLMRYITLHSSDVGEDEAIVKGICSDDLPRFNATSVVINRVAIGDLSGHNPSQYFINYIYSYIKQPNNHPKGLGRGNSSSKIRPKRDTSGEREGDELSTLEGYKNQPKVCIGDAESMRVFASNPRHIANALDPEIPDSKIKLCLEAVTALERMPLDKVQKTLVQWYAKAALPPKGHEELSKTQLLTVMAVCQAALWHWEFHHIAILLTAMPDENYTEHTSILTDSYELSIRYREQFIKLFPYTKGGFRTRSKRSINVGIECIELMTSMIHKRDWISYAPLELKSAHNPTVLNAIPVDPYIRDRLAEAFIKTLQLRSQ